MKEITKNETTETKTSGFKFNFGAIGDVGAMTDTPADDGAKGFSYADFFSEKKRKAAEIRAAIPGIKTGDMFARHQGTYRSLVGVKISVIASRAYKARTNATGMPTEDPKGDKQYADAVLLCYTPDPFVTRLTAGPTKLAVIRQLQQHAQMTEDPEWAGTSDFNTALSAIPPMLRVCGTVTCSTRTSKEGFEYQTPVVAAQVLPQRTAKILEGLLNDEAFMADIETLMAKFINK